MARADIAALIALPLLGMAAACGDESSRARALAETVALEVRKDCEAAAVSEATRPQLRRRCACAEAKVAATPMRFGESDNSIRAKVEAAVRACYEAERPPPTGT